MNSKPFEENKGNIISTNSPTSSQSGNILLFSPISELVNNFSDTSLGTPLSAPLIMEEDSPDDEAQGIKNSTDNDSRPPLDDTDDGIATDDYSLQDESLLSSSFTINSGGRSNAARRTEHHRRDQRRINITPLTLTYDEDDSQIICQDENKMAIDEISFFGSPERRNQQECPPSPEIGLLSPEGSPHKFIVEDDTVTIITKPPSIDHIEGNSTDSGFGGSSSNVTAPALPNQLESSLKDTLSFLKTQSLNINVKENKKSPKCFKIFYSLSSESADSMEDDYMEMLDDDQFQENSQLPSNLNSLISGDIMTLKTTPEMKRPPVRRCLSLIESNNHNPVKIALLEPKKTDIFKPVNNKIIPSPVRHVERCFKRPEPPTISPMKSKRYKIDNKENLDGAAPRGTLRKSLSLNEEHIMHALAKSSSDPDLIGDFSKPFSLPLMDGRHRDLKSISSDTMARLIQGEFSNSIQSYKIIDCRYPYEYEGGHIRGAENLFTHDQILEALVNCKTEAPEVQDEAPKRKILVFHCEFSSERGPKLSRFLRNKDRLRNSHKYPALNYPEIYLLHGGYKEFFEKYSELCDPVSYRPMLDPNFGAAYKQFRAKSKSWNGDSKGSSVPTRSTKSRSRLNL